MSDDDDLIVVRRKDLERHLEEAYQSNPGPQWLYSYVNLDVRQLLAAVPATLPPLTLEEMQDALLGTGLVYIVDMTDLFDLLRLAATTKESND